MASEEDGRPARHLLAIRMFGRDLPWYWTVLILATLLVAVHFGLRQQIKLATQGFLQGFAWLGKGSFRDSSYSFDGVIESSDLAIVADASKSDASIRIPRVSVSTPGLVWLLRAQLPRLDFWKSDSKGGNHYPPTRQLRILFERIDWGDAGMEDVVPDVSWVGPYSGAVFEAAGCSDDWWWHRGEFAEKFKLAEPMGDVSLLFRVETDKVLQQTLEFGTPETSHAIIERRFSLPAADDFLDTPVDQWRTLDVRWSFRDHGFNKARNRYCAEQASISEAEFVDRHIAAVERILASQGMVFSRNMWVAYRRYAEGGKELTWQSNFGEGLTWEDIAGKRGLALYAAINATVHVEGFPRVPYLPEIIDPLPLPEDREYASLFQIMQGERAATATAADPLTASALPDAISPPAAVAIPAATLDTAVAAATVAATTTAAPAPAPAPPPQPQPQAATPVAAQPVSTSSNPTVAAEPALATPPTVEALQTVAPGAQVPTRELGKYLGIYVRVELGNGRAYVGAVAKNDAETLTLNVRMRSGNASLTLPHKQIRRVIRQ
jgi:hypothetical protein